MYRTNQIGSERTQPEHEDQESVRSLRIILLKKALSNIRFLQKFSGKSCLRVVY